MHKHQMGNYGSDGERNGRYELTYHKIWVIKTKRLNIS